MTQDKIIELAQQAGLTVKRNPGFEVLGKLRELEMFAALVAERVKAEAFADTRLVKALKSAIEGECDGLDINDTQATLILRYLADAIEKGGLPRTGREQSRYDPTGLREKKGGA